MSAKKTVAVGLSGGIDSSSAAILLKEQGYNVIGLTAIFHEHAQNDVRQAEKICQILEIPFKTVNFQEEFKSKVTSYFINSYKNGLTPNPCITCNKYLKWGLLMDYALNEIGADFYASGHYAKLQKDENGFKIIRAKDDKKDQLYALYNISQDRLAKILFPLGDIEKNEAKKLVEKYNLPCAKSKESQDICFIKPPDCTKNYLLRNLGVKIGHFVDIHTNKILGKHDGFYQYTIGQRKGIGIAAPNPLYVIKLDANNNIVYVGNKEDLFKNELEINDVTFQQESYKNKKFSAFVKIRYNMTAQKAIVISSENNAIVKFNEPQSAITSGQSAVIYDETNTFLIGGGVIL
ncbi:MAG: tRNA 2-thiouridine(34) synthase MnmA [Candidatus Gastranaerophilales bacterium]|nr:tRNA 2-thiouridine(34) synthase MnmA [Candidatus Gastranaerophilales bacterium]